MRRNLDRTRLELAPVTDEEERALVVCWDRDAFSSDELVPAGPCPSTIDLTGRARRLAYGPFLELEPGVWRATVKLGLCSDAARRCLAVQFGVEPDYTTVEVPRGVPGDLELEICHTITEAAPAQIRLCLSKAAFHGEVRFDGARLYRMESLPSASAASTLGV
jgi:hypothetical protein